MKDFYAYKISGIVVSFQHFLFVLIWGGSVYHGLNMVWAEPGVFSSFSGAFITQASDDFFVGLFSIALGAQALLRSVLGYLAYKQNIAQMKYIPTRPGRVAFRNPNYFLLLFGISRGKIKTGNRWEPVSLYESFLPMKTQKAHNEDAYACLRADDSSVLFLASGILEDSALVSGR